ncbi:MAG: YHS domain-containing protein [Roseibium aggregatum]|jgi:YHS domain-containing protein|uniref:YHS domain-containing protein n=1 Tax=uncultured Roseibium sp. TaxID=1936171 RepID=UPI002631DF4D|nr:YHS domain-containing protein [uncultured Roseibium sp.]
MEALIYFLVWAGLFLLMMRFGCGAHVMGKHAHNPVNGEANRDEEPIRWIPPATDVDPVCGKTVHTNTAKSSVHDGMVYYFCSRECREQFEVAPHLYTGSKIPETPNKMENAHG